MQRLIKDFRGLQNDPPLGVNASPHADNVMQWNAIIFGPDGTIWEDGIFRLTMEFSEDYPQKAPTVKFVSSIFHPNGMTQYVFIVCHLHESMLYLFLRQNRNREKCTSRYTPSYSWLYCAVYADGSICIDILQKAWSPIYNVSAILTSIQSLLSDPNANSPANAEASKLYQDDRAEYNRRVKSSVLASLAPDA